MLELDLKNFGLIGLITASWIGIINMALLKYHKQSEKPVTPAPVANFSDFSEYTKRR